MYWYMRFQSRGFNEEKQVTKNKEEKKQYSEMH
jgi:hypothetical protein